MVTLLNYTAVKTHIASVHRADCKDIERDARANGGIAYGPYATVADAIAEYIDEDMIDMGYHANDVKIHACCKGL